MPIPLFFRAPLLDWIQLEVTTHCNAACLYCPRTAYRNSWINRHYSTLAFPSALAQIRSLTQHLHLQGWGEPLLHPDFFELVSLTKKEGLWVSTTSNGNLIDREMGTRLVESGLDLIALSLAGTREESNDRIRKGTKFSKVLNALEILKKLKEEKKQTKPIVHLAYLTLRSHWGELKDLPGLLSGLGVDQVVISTLDFVPVQELLEEALRPTSPKEEKDMKAFLDALTIQGGKKGVQISYTLPSYTPKGNTCAENPLRALCIASDGLATPCVYTNLPIQGETHFTAEGEEHYERKDFGNISNQSLGAIWEGQAFRQFQRAFKRRKPEAFCRKCPKLR